MDVVFSHLDGPLLPPRQLEILQLARRGKSFTDITDTLGISANTLRWYVSQIRRVFPAFDTVDADPDGLTVREREVAVLVAKGFSNRAISEHLVVGLPTVEYHIGNLYRKTGATNRVHLANVARSRALLSAASIALAEG